MCVWGGGGGGGGGVASVEKMLTICSNGSVPLNKMAAMPIYGKTLKNLLAITK